MTISDLSELSLRSVPAGKALFQHSLVVFFHDMSALSAGDFLVYAKYWLLIWMCIAKACHQKGALVSSENFGAILGYCTS